MNVLACSLFAIVHAPDSKTPRAAYEDWSVLDREIGALADSHTEKSALKLSAWTKVAYRSNDDTFVDLDGDNVQDPNENDLGGILFQGLRVIATGKVGAFDVKISGEAASGGNVGNMSVRDAFARTPLCEYVNVQVGNYRSPFLYSGVASDEKEIFFDRTTQGALWSQREPGLMLDGVHGDFTWWASAQNGGDGGGDEWLLIGKAAFAFIGDPILPKQTGGFGLEAPTSLQLGIGYADDSSAQVGEGTANSIEGVLVSGPVFSALEFLDYDDGFVPGSIPSGQAARASAANVADTAPWAATLGVMLSEEDEIALRFEDLDDAADTKKYWLGYTRFMAGQAAKLQINWIRRDDNLDETDEFLAGLVLSI